MLALLAGVAIVLPERSSACGFHAGIGGGVTVAHTASVPVAMALRNALDAGRLAPLPELAPLLALARANNTMRTFAGLLPLRADTTAVSLVMIESHLWGRVQPDPAGTRFQPHVDGPAGGDIIVVTSEPVLRAMLAGRIDWDTARAAGLIVVDGPAEPAEAMSRSLGRLTSGFAPAPQRAAAVRRRPAS